MRESLIVVVTAFSLIGTIAAFCFIVVQPLPAAQPMRQVQGDQIQLARG